MLLYLCIGFYLYALSSNFTVELFIDEFADELLAGLSPGDVVVNPL